MKVIHRFFIYAFGLFWIAFGVAGVLIAVGAPPIIVEIWKVVMAWAPNVAFVIIYKRLEEQRSLWRYITDVFAHRIRPLPFLASIFLPVAIIVGVWAILSLYPATQGSDLIANLTFSGFVLIFLNMAVRGTLGEELGWRGYALIALNKRHSILRSSLILGTLWGVWHLPLWFLTSGYSGMELLVYIGYFMITIVSFSVIIGYIYRGKRGNLIYPILLHQMFNVVIQLISAEQLLVMGASCVLYLLVAGVMAITIGAGDVDSYSPATTDG